MSKKKRSPAYTGVKHTWDNTGGCTPHSWDRINRSMDASLMLAIDSGQQFDVDDFLDICNDFLGGYWGQYGTDEWERYYHLAITTGNMSAAQSFEAWKGRQPFIVDGPSHRPQTRNRVAIGTRFQWQWHLVTVTSFSADGIVACSYHDRKPGEYSDKIKHRFRISRSGIIADRKDRKERDSLYEGLQVAWNHWTRHRREALLKKHHLKGERALVTCDIVDFRNAVEDAESRNKKSKATK